MLVHFIFAYKLYLLFLNFNFLQFCLCLTIFLSYSKAEYDFHGLPDYHAGPVLAPSYIKAPVIPAPTYIKAIAPAPAPIYAHAAPVIKAIAPATSYATVTQVHVTHPAPVVKVCIFS